jgi:hypothetical protein
MEELEHKGKAVINQQRLDRQYQFQYGEEDAAPGSEFRSYFGNGIHRLTEPFAFLHQH